MVETSESKFRVWCNKYFDNNIYIHKMADFKRIGDGSQRGLPDYLTIYRCNTLWFEVKKVNSKKTFNFSNIRESQWIEFMKMSKYGAKIFLAILMNKKFYIIDFSVLMDLKFEMKQNKLDINIIEQWHKLSELILNGYKSN